MYEPSLKFIFLTAKKKAIAKLSWPFYGIL